MTPVMTFPSPAQTVRERMIVLRFDQEKKRLSRARWRSTACKLVLMLIAAFAVAVFLVDRSVKSHLLAAVETRRAEEWVAQLREQCQMPQDLQAQGNRMGYWHQPGRNQIPRRF